MSPEQTVILLLLIIIVYVALAFKNSPLVNTTLLAAFTCLLLLSAKVYKDSSENLQTDTNDLSAMDTSTNANGLEADVLESNLRDRDISSYDNISHMNDVYHLDNMGTDGQTIRDYKGKNSKWNNADMIESVMERGSSMHQPLEARSADFYDVNDIHAKTKLYDMDDPKKGLYSESTVIFNDRAFDMDERLARKQKHRGEINKKATDGRVRATANLYKKYFTDELDENEKRVWWSNEAKEIDTDFD